MKELTSPFKLNQGKLAFTPDILPALQNSHVETLNYLLATSC